MKKALEIGGGPRPRIGKGYGKIDLTVLDARDDEYTDVIHTVTCDNRLPFLDETFDVVFNSHIFEHIPFQCQYLVMGDWARVVKPGGVVHTVVPSWEWVAKEVLKSPEKRTPLLKWMAFAGQVNEFDVHYNMFTKDMLEEIYAVVGLTVRTSSSRRQVFAVGGRHKVNLEENFIVGVKK